MTTKRKQILKAIAVSGSATIEDLVMTTGLERKNLHDNVKATLKDELCQRIKDDVTGQPAYKLTPKGRAWLENDKDDTASTQASAAKPQPAVGQNSGSKDTGSIVDGGKVGADSLPVGNAVSAPPRPDEMPVAACADVKADPVVKESFTTEMPTDKECCNAAKVVATTAGWHVVQLRKQVAILDAALNTAQATNAALEANANEYQWRLTNKRETIDLQTSEIAMLQRRIAQLAGNAELPLQTKTEPPRYIIADNYMTASSEDEANAIALEIAKNIEIDTPVVVFSAHKARELRINWRDA